MSYNLSITNDPFLDNIIEMLVNTNCIDPTDDPVMTDIINMLLEKKIIKPVPPLQSDNPLYPIQYTNSPKYALYSDNSFESFAKAFEVGTFLVGSITRYSYTEDK